MNIMEAKQIEQDYYKINNPTPEEQFLFIEAMEFLIKETHDSDYMMYLGSEYYEIKRFDLALKYYEMAAEFNDISAFRCLGYIWYYGRTGIVDYEKAFNYFSKVADEDNIDGIICAYKIADMYKNGYYVDKDYTKYKEIIESLYPKVKDAEYLNEPLPEIFIRLAKIRSEEDNIGEALDLYYVAKNFIAKRIRIHPFFGDLSMMKGIINDIHKIIYFDKYDFDLYDLYYILKTPNEVRFYYDGEEYVVKSVIEDDDCVINFNGKWYKTITDFFNNANIDGKLLTAIAFELYDFEVIK
jgi:tetratricopeptide (TPR) repeat protein